MLEKEVGTDGSQETRADGGHGGGRDVGDAKRTASHGSERGSHQGSGGRGVG